MKSRQPKKEPRLPRQHLKDLTGNVVESLKQQLIELEAIQHTFAPDGKQITGEYLARTAFGIALKHHFRRLDSITDMAASIHERV